MGLTRIELVTSSLSGMRSNQLSYSPESDSGTQILLALTVTLNRAHNYFFFQHSHANTTYKMATPTIGHGLIRSLSSDSSQVVYAINLTPGCSKERLTENSEHELADLNFLDLRIANLPNPCNGLAMRLHLPIDLALLGCDTCPACNSNNCELGLWPRQTEQRHYCNDCAYAWTTRTTVHTK